MYSYQHKYHAGNIADFHKHITIIAILQYIQQKPTSCCIIDAFAGDGLYDITSFEAQKNKEFLYVYNRLNKFADHEEVFNHYSNLIGTSTYPGSPTIISSLIRPVDRAIFIENHPQSYEELVKNTPKQRNIKIVKQDCYKQLYSLIKYSESRGFLILDPSYEVKSEYEQIGNLVADLYKIKQNCVFMIWYPIIEGNNYYKKLLQALNSIDNEKIWHHQLKDPNKTAGMTGSGLFVINMPWNVDKVLENLFLKSV